MRVAEPLIFGYPADEPTPRYLALSPLGFIGEHSELVCYCRDRARTGQ